jgi:hypothetical protein
MSISLLEAEHRAKESGTCTISSVTGFNGKMPWFLSSPKLFLLNKTLKLMIIRISL